MKFILDTTFDTLHPGSLAMYRETIGLFPWQWGKRREVIVYDDHIEVATDNSGFAMGKVGNVTIPNPVALLAHGLLDVIPSKLGKPNFLHKKSETLSYAEFKQKHPDIYPHIKILQGNTV